MISSVEIRRWTLHGSSKTFSGRSRDDRGTRQSQILTLHWLLTHSSRKFLIRYFKVWLVHLDRGLRSRILEDVRNIWSLFRVNLHTFVDVSFNSRDLKTEHVVWKLGDIWKIRNKMKLNQIPYMPPLKHVSSVLRRMCLRSSESRSRRHLGFTACQFETLTRGFLVCAKESHDRAITAANRILMNKCDQKPRSHIVQHCGNHGCELRSEKYCF